jgi:hypothetical protein
MTGARHHTQLLSIDMGFHKLVFAQASLDPHAPTCLFTRVCDIVTLGVINHLTTCKIHLYGIFLYVLKRTSKDKVASTPSPKNGGFALLWEAGIMDYRHIFICCCLWAALATCGFCYMSAFPGAEAVLELFPSTCEALGSTQHHKQQQKENQPEV